MWSSRGLKWENKMYKLKRSIADSISSRPRYNYTHFLKKISIILLTLFRNELNQAHLSESNDKDSMETAAVAAVHTDYILNLRM